MIYTIATAKGGTGKTTTAASLVQAAAHTGRRALAIDLDPQGSLSYALAADARAAGSYDLLHGAPAADVVQRSPQGMDVITGSLNLQTETSGPGTARRLAEALEPVRSKYDLIVVDAPATAGELQYNALMAADRLVIVLEADSHGVQALYQITAAAEQIQQSNTRLQPAGVLIARYRGNANIRKYMREQIEATAKSLGIPYLGEARDAAAAAEATAFQQSLFDYAPRSTTAADYMRVFETITK